MSYTKPVAAAGPSPVFDDNTGPLDRQVAMQAAQWFVRIEDADLSAAEQQKFQEWLHAHADHQRAWGRIQRVSQRASGLSPEIASPILRRTTNIERRRAVKVLALLIAAPAVALLAAPHLPGRVQAYQTTATGEQRQVTLPDGTRVHLNTDSEIALLFSQHERLLLLKRGEVLIDTAPDPQVAPDGRARPFRVRTEQGLARAIGTRFVVRQSSSFSTVAVLQGAVELTSLRGGLPQRVDAGQQSRLDADRAGPVEPIDSLHQGMWAQGILAVQDMRLDAFVTELARYRRGVIRCDAEVAGLRMTGAFQLADTDRILQNLIELLPIDVTYYTRFWVNLSARSVV